MFDYTSYCIKHISHTFNIWPLPGAYMHLTEY